MTIKPMFSRTGRSAVVSSRNYVGTSRGDCHHLVSTKTMISLCGRNARDWFDMEGAFSSVGEAAASGYCCARCKAQLSPNQTKVKS